MFVKRLYSKVLAATLLLLVLISIQGSYSNAATAGDFSNANTAINSAFVSTYDAQQKGGNVTVLIQELNTALSLVQIAQAENMTNPSQSALDLQNATNIANLVISQSASVGQSGAAALQVKYAVSISSAVAIAVIAILIYIYGGRIYRRMWLYAYRDHVVKPSG